MNELKIILRAEWFGKMRLFQLSMGPLRLYWMPKINVYNSLLDLLEKKDYGVFL